MSAQKGKSKKRPPMERSKAVIPHGAVCGATNREGSVCRKQPGWGTNHPNQGRCRLHGGATPIRSGRYSSIQRPRIQALIQQHEGDANPLNTFPEIALVRALLQDFIERYEENSTAILSWYLSWSAQQRPLSEDKVMAFERLVDDMEEMYKVHQHDLTDAQMETIASARAFLADLRNPDHTRPRQLLDVSDAYRMAGEVTKMVERVERTRSANAVSRADLLRILSEMGRIVDIYVSEEPLREKIRDGWREIRL